MNESNKDAKKAVPRTVCLSADELRAFQLGDLSEEALDEIASHLERCSSCESAAESLDHISDHVVAAFRRSVEEAALPPAEALRQVGEYEILEKVGQGGMGVVYKARHVQLQRVVALKMLLAETFADGSRKQRFRLEAEAVARLQHANVVQIYEVGEHETSTGQVHPYFTLEFVDGGSLGELLRKGPQTPHQAAVWLEQLARAIHCAHQMGIVHRDLKPSNILLKRSEAASEQASGTAAAARPSPATLVPKICDFGVAKLLAGSEVHTLSGMLLGTAEYMAPEQAEGKADVGPAADIYSLGAVLYATLTGRPPFQGPSALATLNQVMNLEPVSPRRLQPLVPRDLETICLKCLQKEPGRRYASALDLAEDLRRYLADEPILARPSGALTRAAKWARRRPAIAGLLAAVVLVTTVSLGLLTWLWDRAAGNAENERLARLQIERLSAGEWLDRGAVLCARGDVGEGLLSYARALELAQRAQDADLERIARINLGSWPSQLVRPRARFGHTGWAYAVTYSDDGSTIVTGGEDGKVKVWDAADFREKMPPLQLAHPVFDVAISPDGKTVLAGAGSMDGSRGLACVWDLAQPGTPCVLPHDSQVRVVKFSPDGVRFLTQCSQHAQLWRLDETRPYAVLRHDDALMTAAALSPDGTTVLTGGDDGTARLWRLADGRALHTLLEGDPGVPRNRAAIKVAGFCPDGTVFTGNEAGMVRVWDTGTRQPIGPPFWLRGPVRAVSFSPDGNMLAAGCALLNPDPEARNVAPIRGELRAWYSNSARPLYSFEYNGSVRSLAFSADGQLLLAGSADGNARVLDAASGSLVGKPLVHEGTVVNLSFSPKGRSTALTASAGGDGYAAARLWGLPPLRSDGRMFDTQQLVSSIAFAGDGSEVLMSGHDGPAVLRAEPATGKVIPTPLVHSKPITSMLLNREKNLLLTGGADNCAILWDMATQKPRHTFPCSASVWALAFSKTGNTCWTGTLTGVLNQWNTQSGEKLQQLSTRGGSRLIALHTTDDSTITWLESDKVSARTCRFSAAEGVVQMWEQSGRIEAATFRDDGARVLTAEWDESARLRDCRTGMQVGPILSHDSFRVHALAFSPDGTLLLTGGRDKAVRLWDAATGKPLGPPLLHHEGILAVAFSPDGRQFAAGGYARVARIWNVPVPLGGSTHAVRQNIESLTGMELDELGVAREPDANRRIQ